MNELLSERLGTQTDPAAQGESVGRMATGAVTPQRRPTRSESSSPPHGSPKDTSGRPADNTPHHEPRATLVQTLAFRALQPGRHRIVA